MSLVLTSWSFTNTQEPWVWLAFSAISRWDIWTVECPEASAISTSNIVSLVIIFHLLEYERMRVYQVIKKTRVYAKWETCQSRPCKVLKSNALGILGYLISSNLQVRLP